MLEVNTSSVYRGFREDYFPSPAILKEWLTMGGSVTIPGEAVPRPIRPAACRHDGAATVWVELPAGSGPVAPGEEVEVLFFVQ